MHRTTSYKKFSNPNIDGAVIERLWSWVIGKKDWLLLSIFVKWLQNKEEKKMTGFQENMTKKKDFSNQDFALLEDQLLWNSKQELIKLRLIKTETLRKD